MEYKSKLVQELVSILDKRTYLARQELNKAINNLNESTIKKLENSISKIETNLTTLKTNFNTLVNDENANDVIDTFKEVENFLDSISDSNTLTEMLRNMSIDINNEVDIKIASITSSINNINQDLNNISTFKNVINSSFDNIDTSLNYINSSILDISTRINNVNNNLQNTTHRIDTLELNNVTNIDSISGTEKNIWNDTTNDINENSYIIDTNKFNIIENGNSKEKIIKTVNPNIIKEIVNNEKAQSSTLNTINSNITTTNTSVNKLESDIISVKGDINNIDILNTKYINEKNEETKNGFNTISTCFDFIIDNMYYVKPENINVLFTVSPTTIIKGKRTEVTFAYKINNYTNNIENITYNNNNITNIAYTEKLTISDSINRTLLVKTNYKDKKGNSPSNNPYKETKTVTASAELYYWSSTENIFEKSYTNQNKPNWNLYKGTSFTFDNKGVNKYVFFVSTLNKQDSEFFIYKHGSSPTLGGGIINLGTITIKIYDDILTYYLYRTNNVLGGNYDIKF